MLCRMPYYYFEFGTIQSDVDRYRVMTHVKRRPRTETQPNATQFHKKPNIIKLRRSNGCCWLKGLLYHSGNNCISQDVAGVFWAWIRLIAVKSAINSKFQVPDPEVKNQETRNRAPWNETGVGTWQAPVRSDIFSGSWRCCPRYTEQARRRTLKHLKDSYLRLCVTGPLLPAME